MSDASGEIVVEITDQQELLEVSHDQIVSVARHALELEGTTGRLEIALVDDPTMTDLHARFLDDPTPTDVMTFPWEDAEDPFGGLGEIVISTETAIRQAPGFLRDPVLETLMYVVHGVLHLLGYDDRTDADRERMQARQSEILDAWRGRGQR